MFTSYCRDETDRMPNTGGPDFVAGLVFWMLGLVFRASGLAMCQISGEPIPHRAYRKSLYKYMNKPEIGRLSTFF